MTVLNFERYPVEPNHVEAFEALVGVLLEQAKEAPGALWADAARAFDDEPSYILLGEWRTAADLDAWEASDAAATFRDESDALLRGDITQRRLASA